MFGKKQRPAPCPVGQRGKPLLVFVRGRVSRGDSCKRLLHALYLAYAAGKRVENETCGLLLTE